MSLTYDSIKEITQNLELKCKSIAMEIYFDSVKSNLYYLFCSKRSYAVLSILDQASFLLEIFDEYGYELNSHRIAIPFYMLREFKENSSQFSKQINYIIDDTISTMLHHPFINLKSDETPIFSSILNTNYHIMSISKFTDKSGTLSFEVKLELKKDRQVCLVRFKLINNEWVKELLNAIDKPVWCKNLNTNIMKYFDVKALEFYQTSDANIYYINSKGMKFNLEMVFNQKERTLRVSRCNEIVGIVDNIDVFEFQYEDNKNIDKKIFESLYKSVIFDTPNLETLQQLRELDVCNTADELDNNYIDLLDMIKY